MDENTETLHKICVALGIIGALLIVLHGYKVYDFASTWQPLGELVGESEVFSEAKTSAIIEMFLGLISGIGAFLIYARTVSTKTASGVLMGSALLALGFVREYQKEIYFLGLTLVIISGILAQKVKVS